MKSKRHKLKSIAQHNAEQLTRYGAEGQPEWNGIGCPICGAEMLDSNPNITLSTNPPQTPILCPVCNYTGLRFR